MKKNTYINKYNFLDFYTKQPSLWFFSNAEIETAIQLETSLANDNIDDKDDEDELDIDHYDTYKELLLNNKKIDLMNPHIQEGIFIDNKSRLFIKEQYKNIKDIFDLDKIYKNSNIEEKAEYTKKILLEHENAIIFQSVFISNNLITKPDAIIKEGDKIILIETKGTTTAKRYHALDIYFQAKILRSVSYLDDFDLDFKLCLVKYCYANKYELPLIITSYFNFNKTVTIKKEWSIEQKQLAKIGMNPTKNGMDAFISINSICFDSVEDLEARYEQEENTNSKNAIAKTIIFFNEIFTNFEAVIKQLIDHLVNLQTKSNLICKNINPHPNDKNDVKNSELFPLLKKLYFEKGYKLFKYSGNFVDMSSERLKNLEKNINVLDYAKKTKKDIVALCETNDNQQVIVNKGQAKNLLATIKAKKVYFDFETINSSIRSLDHTLPFAQMVTQCSIIKINSEQEWQKFNSIKCNNIVINPREITIDKYKQMIDDLYNGNDSSYIVFNQSFEKNRLYEIEKFINEEQYSAKIFQITNNLVDLADFFKFIKRNQGIIILIKSLGGYYSIKKILPFIENNYHEFFKQAKCIDYHELAISNGQICQNKTFFYFLKKDDDQDEWNRLVDDLKVYCENDVRVMIAIELFIRKLIS